MAYLGLDPDTWDICADPATGDWPMLSECEAVAQNVRTCTQICRGEWFLDTTIGIPFSVAQGANANFDLYEAELKSAILAVPGLNRLTDFSLTRDNAGRAINISYSGITDCSDQIGAVI